MMLQLNEPESEQLDAAHIRARVEDWAARIDALYRDLSAWLPDGFRRELSQGVTMHEELMREFGVPARQLPVLSVFDTGGWKAKVIPFGLWVIGSNGRLDVLTASGNRVIVGRSLDEHVPGWRISSADSRALRELDRESWNEAIH